MTTNVRIQRQRVEAKTQRADVQRRLNGGGLKMWRTVYPDAPLPAEGRTQKGKGIGQTPEVSGRRSEIRGRPAAVGYLARFLCVGFALALLATDCVGPRPLKGGCAITTHKLQGTIEQTLMQGESPSQASRQDQENVKVRIYTVPAGSRVEQSEVWASERPRECKLLQSSGLARTLALPGNQFWRAQIRPLSGPRAPLEEHT